MLTSSFLKSTEKQSIPPWLQNHKPGQKFFLDNFFESRTLFYPGSGHDGQPVGLFAGSHAIHCFIYVDYGVSETEIERDLANKKKSFKGYKTIDQVRIEKDDLIPKGWATHIRPEEIYNHKFSKGFIKPYGFIVILERREGFDEEHGPKRLAVMFLGADGIATYSALFCHGIFSAPFAVVIQDHGFGGNYNTFDAGSLLERMAIEQRCLPKYLLIAQNSRPWNGYAEFPKLEPTVGGEHRNLRRLYRRAD